MKKRPAVEKELATPRGQRKQQADAARKAAADRPRRWANLNAALMLAAASAVAKSPAEAGED